jgi:hypothetical protein
MVALVRMNGGIAPTKQSLCDSKCEEGSGERSVPVRTWIVSESRARRAEPGQSGVIADVNVRDFKSYRWADANVVRWSVRPVRGREEAISSSKMTWWMWVAPW